METLLEKLDGTEGFEVIKKFIIMIEKQQDAKLYASERYILNVNANADKINKELESLLEMKAEMEKQENENTGLGNKKNRINKYRLEFKISKVDCQKGDVLTKNYVKTVLEIAAAKAILKATKELLEIIDKKETLGHKRNTLDLG